MLRVIALASATLLASTAAMAADNGLYIGAGVSQSAIDFDVEQGTSNFSFDGKNTKYKVIVGFRPFDWLAAEVNYIDFGSIDVKPTATSPTGQYTLKGLDAFAVGFWEIGVVDIFAKVGGVQTDRQVENVPSLAVEDGGTFGLAYGAGVGMHFGSLGARIEFEKFEVDDNTDVEAISLGVTWTLF